MQANSKIVYALCRGSPSLFDEQIAVDPISLPLKVLNVIEKNFYAALLWQFAQYGRCGTRRAS
ncbi:hypothetical protein BH11PSE12_BH11PSE12_26120 [soil metagenome]